MTEALFFSGNRERTGLAKLLTATMNTGAYYAFLSYKKSTLYYGTCVFKGSDIT